MDKIECPHCEEDVLLDDRAHGLFDCPHCNNEFSRGRSYRPRMAVTILLVFSFLCAIGAVMTSNPTASEYEPCENCSWEESMAEGIGQGVGAGAGEAAIEWLSHQCLILSGVLLLVAIVTYAIQHFRRVE